MSLWAYMWMLIVYQFWTPDRITMLEAFLTLLFMPMLIGVAYLLDAKPWERVSSQEEPNMAGSNLYQVPATIKSFTQFDDRTSWKQSVKSFKGVIFFADHCWGTRDR